MARKPTTGTSRPGRPTKLPGSERRSTPEARNAGAVPDDELIEVTVIVRPRSPLPRPEDSAHHRLAGRRYLTRREFAARYGVDPQDLAAVTEFATECGLTVSHASAARRSVVVVGSAKQLSEAFQTRLARCRSPHGEHRGRTGPIYVPRNLSPIVEGVFGLDNRPQAQSKGHTVPPEHMDRVRPSSFTPKRVAELYDFPGHLDGTGQRIAVIELAGGFRRRELEGYFTGLGLPTPKITTVSVDGGRNRPGHDREADNEVMGDIEVIGAVAPGAEMRVYFAPLTDRGFLDALTTAIFDRHEPSVISISWGQAEPEWTEQARRAMDDAFRAAAALGITVCAATGDAGWTDNVSGRHAHVDYPASSPYVLACGGTSLTVQDNEVSETVWNNHNGNATGGGVSAVYELPAWQRKAGVPRSALRAGRGRGVPDVAGNADPQTGYLIGAGQANFGWGGTSAVAPLWAGLVACLNQGLGQRVGHLNPLLYEGLETADAFNDIAQGGNGAYRARRGRWDACTGHGTPRGQALLAALATSASAN